MPDPNTRHHPTRRDALSIAWEVVGLIVFLVLAVALALAIFRGSVTEFVAIALLITFRGFLALRR
jgi:hypothetical protein